MLVLKPVDRPRFLPSLPGIELDISIEVAGHGLGWTHALWVTIKIPPFDMDKADPLREHGLKLLVIADIEYDGYGTASEVGQMLRFDPHNPKLISLTAQYTNEWFAPDRRFSRKEKDNLLRELRLTINSLLMVNPLW